METEGTYTDGVEAGVLVTHINTHSQSEQDKERFESNLLHEMAHVIGLVHEHQRSDRDSYMGIRYEKLTAHVVETNEAEAEEETKEAKAKDGFKVDQHQMLMNTARTSTLSKLKLLGHLNGANEIQLGDYDLESISHYALTGSCKLKPEFTGKPHNFCDPALTEEQKKMIGGCDEFDADKYCGPDLENPTALSDKDKKAINFIHRTMIQLRTNLFALEWDADEEYYFLGDKPFSGFKPKNGIIKISQAEIDKGATQARNSKTVKRFEIPSDSDED